MKNKPASEKSHASNSTSIRDTDKAVVTCDHKTANNTCNEGCHINNSNKIMNDLENDNKNNNNESNIMKENIYIMHIQRTTINLHVQRIVQTVLTWTFINKLSIISHYDA